MIILISALEDIMQMIKTTKQQEGTDAETARHLAVAYTLLEYAYSYIQTYLVKESE